jgi:hypothetical protein
MLYLTLVRFKLEYASAVWDSVTSVDANKLVLIQQEFCVRLFQYFFTHIPYSYTFALEKLSLCSLRKRRHHLVALIVRFIVALNSAFPSWKMIIFIFPLATLGASQRLVVATLINTVLLLAVPMLLTWWVKTSIYLQSKRLLPVTFYNLLPKFVNNILGSVM